MVGRVVGEVQTAEVRLWGKQVGAVTWLADKEYGVFEYAGDFLRGTLDLSPIQMSLQEARQRREPIFEFTHLNRESFKGLPGLLADCLPDKFGNSVINTWLARQGRDAASFSAVERLCYTGTRAMGALEFFPTTNKRKEKAVPIEVAELAALAQEIMAHRDQLNVELSGTENDHADALIDILRVGTSAGGARPKAIIAMDEKGSVRSGQAAAPKGYDYWLLKFDGVTDLELGEPKGYGRIEYAYSLMAEAAGIHMTECRLLEENGRAHFLTKRFDRVGGDKLHMQSLCGLAHYDFNAAGSYGYEQAFSVMRKLRLPKSAAVQQYRRLIFNVLGRNQDDHTKNIAFLMNKEGAWSLSPAFDVTYSHNPAGEWTNQHQMTINGKRDHFTLEDLVKVGSSIRINKPEEIIQEVETAIAQWPECARQSGLGEARLKEVQGGHRSLFSS